MVRRRMSLAKMIGELWDSRDLVVQLSPLLPAIGSGVFRRAPGRFAEMR